MGRRHVNCKFRTRRARTLDGFDGLFMRGNSLSLSQAACCFNIVEGRVLRERDRG